MTHLRDTFTQEDGSDDPEVGGVQCAKENELHEEFVAGLGDDTPCPRAVVVHLAHAATQLFAVVRSVRLPVVALVTPQRHALIIADVRIILSQPAGCDILLLH